MAEQIYIDPRDAVGPKDKIQILLSEYATLRAEILSRTGYGFQLTAIGAAAAAWLLQQPLGMRFWIGLVLLVVVATLATWVDLRDLALATARLKEIEHQVNELAGERLLVWESIWGGFRSRFWISRFWSARPPLREQNTTRTTQDKPVA